MDARRVRRWATIDKFVENAKEMGVPLSQVALSWLSDRPSVTPPIVGARTLKHLADNLGAVELVSSSDAMSALDDVSASVSGGYPYGAFGVGQRARAVGSSVQDLGALVGKGS